MHSQPAAIRTRPHLWEVTTGTSYLDEMCLLEQRPAGVTAARIVARMYPSPDPLNWS